MGYGSHLYIEHVNNSKIIYRLCTDFVILLSNELPSGICLYTVNWSQNIYTKRIKYIRVEF